MKTKKDKAAKPKAAKTGRVEALANRVKTLPKTLVKRAKAIPKNAQKNAQRVLGKAKKIVDPVKKVLGRKSSVGPKKHKGPTPRDYHKEQMDYMPRLSTPERKSNPRYSRIDLGAGKKVGSKLAKAYKRTKNK